MATSQRGSKLRCQETYSSRLPAYTPKLPTRFFQQTKKHAWHYCHPPPRAKKRKASTSLTHTSKTSGNTVSFHSEGSPFPEPERGKAQTQLDGRRTCFLFCSLIEIPGLRSSNKPAKSREESERCHSNSLGPFTPTGPVSQALRLHVPALPRHTRNLPGSCVGV